MNSCRVNPIKRLRYHWLAVSIKRSRDTEKWKRNDMSRRKAWKGVCYKMEREGELHYLKGTSVIKGISLKNLSRKYRSRRAGNIVYFEYQHNCSKDLNHDWNQILQLCYSIINISLRHSSQCSLRGGLIGLPSHSSHCSIAHLTLSLLWIILAYPLGPYRSLMSCICCPTPTAWLLISLLLPTFYGSPGFTKLAWYQLYNMLTAE